MGKELILSHITSEYFVCRICRDIVRDPVECRICEQLFCNNCLSGFIENSQEYTCPHGCVDPVFEKAGHAFEKLMGFIYIKCKFTECLQKECIKSIKQHEDLCRYKKLKKIEIDVQEDQVAQRDLFWIGVLNKVLTPANQYSGMQGYATNNVCAFTPRAQNCFKF